MSGYLAGKCPTCGQPLPVRCAGCGEALVVNAFGRPRRWCDRKSCQALSRRGRRGEMADKSI